MSYVSYTTRFINVFLLFFHSLPFYEGMTETCSSLTFMTLHDPTLQTPAQTLQTVDKTKSSSAHQPHGVCVGKPPPHVELKISADEPSTIGRILTRGPHLMLRYWDQNPMKATESTNDFWLDTGDIGSIDDCGNVWLVGRQNAQIKSGGENIYPEEVSVIYICLHNLLYNQAITTESNIGTIMGRVICWIL